MCEMYQVEWYERGTFLRELTCPSIDLLRAWTVTALSLKPRTGTSSNLMGSNLFQNMMSKLEIGS